MTGTLSGTAGRPRLEVLTGSRPRNIAVVVTRYFGGTLLGTGVRCGPIPGGEGGNFGSFVKDGIMRKVPVMTTDYNDVGKNCQYYFGQQGIVPAESIYAENVKFILLVQWKKRIVSRKN